jgi:large repetitive protein
MVNGLAYLMGGRGIKNVDVYNPSTGVWTPKTGPPIELHHMQCVAVPTDNQIFIVSAWTGGYPMERNVDKIYVRINGYRSYCCQGQVSLTHDSCLYNFSMLFMYATFALLCSILRNLILSAPQIYNILNDTWSGLENTLPEPRRRGGAASVLVGRKIYVSHGNRGGHETGNFSTSYGWLDYYNIDSNTWVTNLPDAPNPRDHTGGGLINKRYICVAGGRDGGNIGFFNLVVLPTDCFDLQTNTWSVEDDIPQGRAGSSYGTTCDGKYLLVAGGEAFSKAWPNVEAFDGKSYIKLDDLNIPRHGSGLAVDCTKNSPCENQVHIASGAAGQGGGREITSVETYFPNGMLTIC